MLTRRLILSIAAISPLPVTMALAAEAAPAYGQAALKAAQDSGRPILIEIQASWCPTCKARSAVLEPMLKQDTFKSMAVFRVDFDAQKPVVRAFGADMQSTLIVIRGATEVGRVVGETDGAAIELPLVPIVLGSASAEHR